MYSEWSVHDWCRWGPPPWLEEHKLNEWKPHDADCCFFVLSVQTVQYKQGFLFYIFFRPNGTVQKVLGIDGWSGANLQQLQHRAANVII